MKYFERRYHVQPGRHQTPLARLGHWVYSHPEKLLYAPPDLLAEALRDVSDRLPAVAAREPTRRHRKHFSWLLGWQTLISEVMGRYS